MHNGFQNLQRMGRSISLAFLEILGSLPHDVGHVSDAKDLYFADLSKRIERSRFHLDRKDTSLLCSFYCF